MPSCASEPTGIFMIVLMDVAPAVRHSADPERETCQSCAVITSRVVISNSVTRNARIPGLLLGATSVSGQLSRHPFWHPIADLRDSRKTKRRLFLQHRDEVSSGRREPAQT